MPHRVPIEATLDLHSFRPEDVTSVVAEYLTAAAEAGLPDVRVVHGRTDLIDYGFGANAARVTIMTGSATHIAAHKLREHRIDPAASDYKPYLPRSHFFGDILGDEG